MNRTVPVVAMLIVGVLSSADCWAQRRQGRPIVHDVEYCILAAQNGERWAAEDKEIDAKLAELRKKHGTAPNIVYIPWDDMTFGAVGFPALQKNFGFTTPNLNRLATLAAKNSDCKPSAVSNQLSAWIAGEASRAGRLIADG